MFSLSHLLSFACLLISLAESAFIPAFQGTPATSSNPPDLNRTTTDTSNIVSTAQQVDRKSGASSDAPPDQPATNTTITAINGDLVNQTILTTTSSRHGLYEISRQNNNYEQFFGGTGTGPNDRDASIEGTVYLTYTVFSNATYDVDDCLDYCDSVAGCVFANLYYKFENLLLDLVFSQGSNLKCAVYADVHSAVEKTNFGGQQLYPAPAPLNYIQQSKPAASQGYDKVFGPTGGANNAPGYMGFAFLNQYDVAACATLCDTRGADPVGGACQYFNI
ncbi:hypothetical protein BT96DRAFT_1005580 [Gymnopus androsaceus JB14]|uniref:Apple domain-containing protein n=1 Tax=Gymnopus androsaceus JB14 TaxID=1447944 RepID=A0A6A4GNZ5_9AGAR|nr:hypothetical protein BT96DRAFT_1005580 [Gymnopus androsaceus JB14]